MESKMQFYEWVYTKNDPDDPWYTFYQTGDWYDIPNSIRTNDWIYPDTEAPQRWKYREHARRFCIFPKDVQYMYDCTPELARGILNDVRETLGLSVSVPVTCYDLQEYTQLDLQTILDFILES
jgi:hypothetical protein